MKWYFALSAASFASGQHDWASLIRVSLRTALANTTLRPHLLWDGPEHEFLDEMRALGVTVLFHRVSFYQDLAEHRKEDRHGLAIAAGCFLRTEIPLLEKEDEFVLYTDSDVMFLKDPVPALRERRPDFFASSTEFTFEDGLNSGVMLINVWRMREDYPAFRDFIRSNLSLGLDQTMFRKFYEGRWEKLPPAFNWKPYWGADENAVILHWHGIKPVVVKRLFADPAATTSPSLMLLAKKDPAGYRHYLEAYDEWLSSENVPEPRIFSAQRVAVVLVVKDEKDDILAWLAWHKLLGFDAAIIYDDDSTDGTWEVLQAVARQWDIRLSRTIGPRHVKFQKRQADSYRNALEVYKEEFEWYAYFDADEYLLLNQDKDVKTFLARFPDADEVAVNWCNYGSSGYVLKPQLPPPLAYHAHSSAKRAVNRHVKCFVRPSKVGGNWFNVHCFDVDSERSLLANGQKIAWSETRGIIDADPDWSVAKLMHYQCRSMEHFIERLKKRPQFQNVPNLWQSYDMRDEDNIIPPILADGLLKAIAAFDIHEALPSSTTHLETPEEPVVPLNANIAERLDAYLAASKIRNASQIALEIDKHAGVVTPDAGVEVASNWIFDIGMAEGNDTAYYLAKGFNVAGVEADAKAFYELQDRFEEEIKSGRLIIHNEAAAARGGEILEFFHHEQNPRLSGLSYARPEFASGYKSYFVSTINWPALIAAHGIPHYMKIDIEGSEAAFLSSATADRLPRFISVGCHELAPVEALYALGYRRFMLVDQKPEGGFRLPSPQLEGQLVENPSWAGTSGPFGLDLQGEWLDFEGFKAQWMASQPLTSRTWFDCHAALG